MSGTTTEAAPSPVASDLIGSGVEGGLNDQIKAWWQRVRGGDMGALPAVGGLIVLSLLFTVLSPFFLTERNFANLLNQAAPLVVLGMALVFVLLLGGANAEAYSLGYIVQIGVGVVVEVEQPVGQADVVGVHVRDDDAQDGQALELRGEDLLPLRAGFVARDAAVHDAPALDAAVGAVHLVAQEPDVDVVERERQTHADPADAGRHVDRFAGGRQPFVQGVVEFAFEEVHVVVLTLT